MILRQLTKDYGIDDIRPPKTPAISRVLDEDRSY